MKFSKILLKDIFPRKCRTINLYRYFRSSDIILENWEYVQYTNMYFDYMHLSFGENRMSYLKI
jgi:hypothetical protein